MYLSYVELVEGSDDMSKADSSDIVRHLRTVHFSLVLVSVLVGFSLYGYSSNQSNGVYGQFEAISRIKTDWATWTKRFGAEQIKWLKEQSMGWPDKIRGEVYIPPEELTRDNLPQSDNGWTVRPLYSPIYIHLSVNLPSGSRHEILGSGWPREGETELIPGGYDAVGEPRLDTIEEFRQFWNASNNVVAFVVQDMSEDVYVVSNGEIKATLRWIQSSQPRSGTQTKLGRMNIGLREGGDFCKDVKELLASTWSQRFNVLFCGQAPPRPREDPSQIIVLPARYKDEHVPVNLRVWLANHYKFSAVGQKFEETFPELYGFVKKRMHMKLSDVEQLLQSEMQRERSAERVEVLGFKFRERDLTGWGALFIVIIQAYFLIHLRELSLQLLNADHSSKAAWIGLYQDWFARTVSLLTASALPVVILFSGSRLHGFWGPVFTLLTLGVVLSIETARLLWHLPELTTAQNSQHM